MSPDNKRRIRLTEHDIAAFKGCGVLLIAAFACCGLYNITKPDRQQPFILPTLTPGLRPTATQAFVLPPTVTPEALREI